MAPLSTSTRAVMTLEARYAPPYAVVRGTILADTWCWPFATCILILLDAEERKTHLLVDRYAQVVLLEIVHKIQTQGQRLHAE